MTCQKNTQADYCLSIFDGEVDLIMLEKAVDNVTKSIYAVVCLITAEFKSDSEILFCNSGSKL